jgi:hypothetical protein
MNDFNKTVLIVCLMLVVSSTKADLIISLPIGEMEPTPICNDHSLQVCQCTDIPNGSYDTVRQLLSEYNIGDTTGGSEIVGYRSAIYCNPTSLIVHSSSGTLDTGNLLFRNTKHVTDGVWSGEAEVSWYLIEISSVPEPSTLLLMATCLTGFGIAALKKKKYSA